MPGTRVEKVEGFKLSGDQRAWMKVFKQVDATEKGLKQQLEVGMNELERMQELHREVMGRKQELLRLAPVNELKELQGQEGEEAR